jgi:uncharacterized protein YceK
MRKLTKYKLEHFRKLLLQITMMLLLQSCIGTASTRFQNDSFVGAYPYSAVGTDLVLFGENLGKPAHLGGFIALPSLISIPLDLVVDSILLPIDLITWPFGLRKTWASE